MTDVAPLTRKFTTGGVTGAAFTVIVLLPAQYSGLPPSSVTRILIVEDPGAYAVIVEEKVGPVPNAQGLT